MNYHAEFLSIGIIALLGAISPGPDFAIVLKNALQYSRRAGFLTNLLNPKCIVFILSIFTLVVTPQTPHYVQVIYGLELVLFGLAWFLTLSFLLTHSLFAHRIKKVQPFVVKCLGLFLIALGVKLFI